MTILNARWESPRRELFNDLPNAFAGTAWANPHGSLLMVVQGGGVLKHHGGVLNYPGGVSGIWVYIYWISLMDIYIWIYIYLKASPLPPAPWRLISWGAGDRFTVDMDDLLNRLTTDMDHFLKLWGPILVPWELDFCTLGHQLVIQGSTGAPKETPWGPGLDFHRFFMKFGIHFGVVFETSACFFLVWDD